MHRNVHLKLFCLYPNPHNKRIETGCQLLICTKLFKQNLQARITQQVPDCGGNETPCQVIPEPSWAFSLPSCKGSVDDSGCHYLLLPGNCSLGSCGSPAFCFPPHITYFFRLPAKQESVFMELVWLRTLATLRQNKLAAIMPMRFVCPFVLHNQAEKVFTVQTNISFCLENLLTSLILCGRAPQLSWMLAYCITVHQAEFLNKRAAVHQ